MSTWNNDFVWGVVITGVFVGALYAFFRTYSIALVDDAADAPGAASHTSNASYTAWTTVDKRFVGTAPTSLAPAPSVPSSVQLTTVPTILSVPKSSLSPASTPAPAPVRRRTRKTTTTTKRTSAKTKKAPVSRARKTTRTTTRPTRVRRTWRDSSSR